MSPQTIAVQAITPVQLLSQAKLQQHTILVQVSRPVHWEDIERYSYVPW